MSIKKKARIWSGLATALARSYHWEDNGTNNRYNASSPKTISAVDTEQKNYKLMRAELLHL